MRQSNIRNFCIIAHIDHGKSTFADRLLELTRTVEKRKMKAQLLDQMDLERERGITIKLQPVRMHAEYGGVEYELNLIDTPGHVDFHYEVSRSLAAVEGAVLLVDATKGVQAQTLANLYLAIEQGLEIIPVINKIDLPNAEVEKTRAEIAHILGGDPAEILLASGKTGMGVDAVLQRIIERVPAPGGDEDAPLRALIFDSVYDTYKGVVAYVKVVDGRVSGGEMLHMLATGKEGPVVEVGFFAPQMIADKTLAAGDIGYLATGLKDVAYCRVGDTVTLHTKAATPVIALSGYREIRPAVYASFYPLEGDDYALMRDALEKLKLNDAAFVFEPESNQALGRGFRCGFLGLLHLEIIQARLDREFDLMPTITTPSVVYELQMRGETERHALYAPADMPDPAGIETIYEPFVALSIVAPSEYLGGVMTLTQSIRAEYKNTEYLDAERVLLSFEAPLMDVIVNFHDDLKSVSSGYASMNYEEIGYRPSDVVKLDILVNEDPVDAFARLIPRSIAHTEGKRVVEKLKEAIPRQNFAIKLQAAIGGKVVARETIAAYRKDVTGKLYGGDYSRKKKLLEKQKKGKKKMREIGKVSIPSTAFLSVLRK
ncbi:MAG: translation elongation factor 4 [Candidatus Moraniibacteriota bacterium]